MTWKIDRNTVLLTELSTCIADDGCNVVVSLDAMHSDGTWTVKPDHILSDDSLAPCHPI